MLLNTAQSSPLGMARSQQALHLAPTNTRNIQNQLNNDGSINSRHRQQWLEEADAQQVN